MCILCSMMQRTRQRIQAKQLLLTCFVLFALSPCVIKRVLAGTVQVEYAKPLNKSRLIQSSSCYITQDNSDLISAESERNSSKLLLLDYRPDRHFNTVLPEQKLKYDYSKTFSGTSTPKYLLLYLLYFYTTPSSFVDEYHF